MSAVVVSDWREATTRSPHFAISETPAFEVQDAGKPADVTGDR